MHGKKFGKLDNIPEVAEKLELGRRRFLRRLTIATSLGILGALTEKTEACPCVCNLGCDSCDYHECETDDVCDTDVCARDVCINDTCGIDICKQDSCATDICISSDMCGGNTCNTNTCETNVCGIDKCGTDTCTEDDRCSLGNCCMVEDTDCGAFDLSCLPVINTCDVD